VRVAEFCGGLPLALRIAGVRLTADHTLSMPAMASRLADSRRRLHHLSVADIGLRHSLDLGYCRLTTCIASTDPITQRRRSARWRVGSGGFQRVED
jgi:hypothetical protein